MLKSYIATMTAPDYANLFARMVPDSDKYWNGKTVNVAAYVAEFIMKPRQLYDDIIPELDMLRAVLGDNVNREFTGLRGQGMFGSWSGNVLTILLLWAQYDASQRGVPGEQGRSCPQSVVPAKITLLVPALVKLGINAGPAASIAVDIRRKYTGDVWENYGSHNHFADQRSNALRAVSGWDPIIDLLHAASPR